MISALVVEDEPKAREFLRNMIKSHCSEIEIIGTAKNIFEAKELILSQKPQLVFLDIEMPKGDAFDLLDSLPVLDFEIVFTTAYDEHALKAFQYSAANYLLKPISIKQLVLATERVKKIIHSEHSQALSANALLLENRNITSKKEKKIALPNATGFEIVRVADILYCEADDNYTKFYFTNSSNLLVSKTLKHFQELLGEFDFIRTHRSYLVNLEYIEKYIRGKTGTLILQGNISIPVSSTYKESLMKELG